MEVVETEWEGCVFVQVSRDSGLASGCSLKMARSVPEVNVTGLPDGGDVAGENGD